MPHVSLERLSFRRFHKNANKKFFNNSQVAFSVDSTINTK